MLVYRVARQVRFYEARGLITSARAPNNYRDYSETALARVQQIRELLKAGLSTQLILAIFPCLESPRDPIVFEGVTPETVVALEQERDQLSERIDVLTRNRDAVARYLAEVRQRAGALAVGRVLVETGHTVDAVTQSLESA